jgi:hypothetical protein
MRKFRFGFLIILIFLMAYFGQGVSAEEPKLFTRITSYEEFDITYIGEGCSAGLSYVWVTFPIEIEIWNPYNETIRVTTTNYDLFDPGVDIDFENETYSVEVGGIEMPALGIHDIPSKLSRYNYTIQMVICADNFTTLPYGNYTFWGEIVSDTSVGFIRQFLLVNETGYFFTEDAIPRSWGMVLYYPTTNTAGLGFVWLSALSLTLVYFYKKRRYQLKKN